MAPPPQLVVVGIVAVHNIVVVAAADRTLVVGIAAVHTPAVAAAVAAIVRHNWNFHHHRNCIAHCCIGRGVNVTTTAMTLMAAMKWRLYGKR